MHVKDDFNPFKHHKVIEAAQVGASSLFLPRFPFPFRGADVLRVYTDFCLRLCSRLVMCAAPTWPFNGKRYMQMFPPIQNQPQQQSPPMAPPGPPPPMQAPTSYEEDTAQQAARGYVYAYPPYPYPGQVCLCCRCGL